MTNQITRTISVILQCSIWRGKECRRFEISPIVLQIFAVIASMRYFQVRFFINQHTKIFHIILGLQSNISIFLVIEHVEARLVSDSFDKDERFQN